jgi:hypothetical protein
VEVIRYVAGRSDRTLPDSHNEDVSLPQIDQPRTCVRISKSEIVAKVRFKLFESFAIYQNCLLLHRLVILSEIEVDLLADSGTSLRFTSTAPVKSIVSLGACRC